VRRAESEFKEKRESGWGDELDFARSQLVLSLVQFICCGLQLITQGLGNATDVLRLENDEIQSEGW
jgi:hypothetical protein